MKKFNNFTVLVIVMTLIAAISSPVASALNEPYIQAEAALLVEMKSGKILYEKNKKLKIDPGSMAKTMVVLLVVESIENGTIGLKDNVTASDTFLNGIGTNDTIQNIKSGETMNLQDLLYCAYIASANDACNILAEYMSGDVETFVKQMNLKSEELGCTGTHFTSPGGISDENQFSTPWDQYLIFNEAVKHQLFLSIAGTLTAVLAPTKMSGERHLTNSNSMIHSDSAYYYPHCTLGKTTASVEGGYSFVSCADNSDLKLISVLFGADSVKREDETVEVRSYTETKRLFEWGFSSFAWQTILDKSAIVAYAPVVLAQGTENIDLQPSNSLVILAPRDLSAGVVYNDVVIFEEADGKLLTAPIKKGTVLGEITVYVNGVQSGRTKLIAASDISLNQLQFIKENIKMTLSTPWVRLVIGLIILMLGGYIYLIVRDMKKRHRKQRSNQELKQKLIEERWNTHMK